MRTNYPDRKGWLKRLFAGAVISLLFCRPAPAAPSLYAPPTISDQRQYAPHREIDILHLLIDVTPDFRRRTIAGKVTLQFKPIAKALPELKLDGVNLRVQAVSASEKIQGWQASLDKVTVTFVQPAPPDKEVSVTIEYSAEPREGLYFRTPEMGYQKEDMHLFTQGEAIHARHWYPCFDAPNERFTSEIICRVPDGMVVLSNGRLISQEKDTATGLVAVRWLQDKPHVNYLISLVAGHFKKMTDQYRDIPIAFWTVPSAFAYVQNSFKDTKDMLAFFEQDIGVPYPWAKYDQVCVQDFVAGGMENTSITTMREETLHTDEFETLRSSQGLVAHELAHQWFGDLVTCKDWSHLWLNEGFATYYEHLYDGHKDGREELLYRLYQDARNIIRHPDQTNAIMRRDFSTPNEQFNHLNYGKGGWVLHMLRSQLGEALYCRCIKTYLERHHLGIVVTEDLNRVVEELSGRSFDQFFDQWIYHASQPDLGVSYEWNERAKLAKVSLRQDQRLSERVLLFEFPLTIRFKVGTNIVDRQITVRQKAEDFYFPLPEAPRLVRIDPELTLLARINFNPPPAMLDAQLKDESDMLGRLMAVEQLGERRERGAVEKLKGVLNNDPFYGVRLAASQALRAIGTDEAFDALVASGKQSDARARRQVVADIGGFYREASCNALLKILGGEKNPDIQATAIWALGAYHRPEIREKLLAYLNSKSFRNVLADAAIAAIRSQDEAAYIEPLMKCLRQRQAEFTTTDFGQGLNTLAWLAREQDRKEAVREFLLGQVNSPRRRVQLAAINALGTLGDAKAVAALEKFADAPKDRPERAAAENAIEAIRAKQKSAASLAALRNEVLTLQKDNRDLRKEMDDLKKKFDALLPTLPAAKTNQPPPARK
jgi:aminopeptidase N